ncbi:hypothetical protein ACFYPZ_41160 [Streptomyces sp. NPDC005506]|uniref:hypothetical protein n=1 Tax=Streptomyces sp. NPDC005506 TaxID=3364718 RepID=UPI00369DAFEE
MGLDVGEAQAFEGRGSSAVEGGDVQVPGDAEAGERERPQGEGFQVSPVVQFPPRGLPQSARRLDAPPLGSDLLLDDVAEVDQVRCLADAVVREDAL